jgi:O-succinylbenzoic acid--CoA ligase
MVHAAALCRARLLPLNARLTASELALQLARSRAGHLVHGAGDLAERARIAVDQLPEGDLRVTAAGQLDAAAQLASEDALEEDVDLDEIFAVLFTSGTSGEPKGVCLTHGNFQASALATALHLGLRGDDGWLACLPLFHIGGLSILMRNALLGTPVLLHERFDPEQVSAAIDAGISHVSLVPTMLGRLLEARAGRPAPASLRGILLGGAAAPPLLLERAHKLGFPLLPSYGLTEACSQVATCPPGDFDTASQFLGSAGRALFGTEIRIADESGGELPPGCEGEILVRGPTVMAGYLDDAAASARALRGGWLHTGDVGALDRSGRLRVFDRRVDLVVSGGENVSPAEVEAVLLEHPDVAEVGVGGLPDPDLGSQVTAWVVTRTGARCAASELQRFCRRRLAGYKIPRQIRFVTGLPRNSSGKLLRRCLAELAPAETTPQSERV